MSLTLGDTRRAMGCSSLGPLLCPETWPSRGPQRLYSSFLCVLLPPSLQKETRFDPVSRLAPLKCHSFIGRVKSTPDPDAFEKYRDTPPISIAIFLQKYALPLGRNEHFHHQFVSRYASHLYCDAFAEV